LRQSAKTNDTATGSVNSWCRINSGWTGIPTWPI